MDDVLGTGTEPTGESEPRRESVSRRALLGAGALAAGAAGTAAGALLGGAGPAGAQTPPAASDVTFTPVGQVSATNVQAAIQEVDAEKQPISTLDIRITGASTAAGTDNRAAIQAAIDVVAGSGGGTVLIPAGVFGFKGEITLKPAVDLWGCGGHSQGVGSGGSTLKALDAAARLVVQGVAGQTGNFCVDGARVANPSASRPGLVFLDGVSGAQFVATARCFTTMRVAGSLSDGLVIKGAQNCVFTQCNSLDHVGNALILDSDARSSAFIRCDFGDSRGDNVLIRVAQQGDQPPTNNVFIRCAMERGYASQSSQNNSQLRVAAGFENYFYNCGFTYNGTSDSRALVRVEGGWVGLVSCDVLANSSVSDMWAVHCLVSDGVRFHGNNTIAGANGVKYDPTGAGENMLQGRMAFAPGMRKWGATDTNNLTWQFLARAIERQQDIAIDAADNRYAIRARRNGESGIRWIVGTDGQMGAADGTSWDPQVVLRVAADRSAWETPQGLRVGGVLGLQELTADPDHSGLPAGTRAAMYVRNDKLVVAFKTGTTVQYKWLLLTGNGVTWSTSTSPPT
jgi:hypothetical protein